MRAMHLQHVRFESRGVRYARLVAAWRLPLVVIAFMFGVGTVGHAATYSWQALSGDWSVASNWGGTVPTANDFAGIANGGTAMVTTANAACGTLSLGDSGGSGTVRLTGGSLSSTDAYIGRTGEGAIDQSAGANILTNRLYLGDSANSVGSYTLSGSGLLYCFNTNGSRGECIGYSGSACFTQSGGTNTVVGDMTIAYNPGSIGLYTLSSGVLRFYNSSLYFGSGTGAFIQTGGANLCTGQAITLGYSYGSSGSYNLSGGSLVAQSESVGNYGKATFSQSGGWNSVSSYVSVQRGSSYSLSAGSLSVNEEYISGTLTQSGGVHSATTFALSGFCTLGGGVLSAGGESIDSGIFEQTGGSNLIADRGPGLTIEGGDYSLSGSGCLTSNGGEWLDAGNIVQSGGVNTTGGLDISSYSYYQLSGGSLHAENGFANLSVFDGGSSSGTLSANCLLDLTSGTWQNLSHTTLSLGANSLLIVPQGFNPKSMFGGFHTLGLTHTAGSTLVVPAGASITGMGTINDPVICQGTITSYTNTGTNSPCDLLGFGKGLLVTGTGSVELGDGNLVVNDAVSGMSGSYLHANSICVGSGGTGTFAHTGGVVSTETLVLGDNATDVGNYQLSGSAALLYVQEWGYIGYNGKANFVQSGASTECDFYNLLLGYGTQSSGSYALSGSAVLSVDYLSVGYSGSGTFTQSGGSVSIGRDQFYLGVCSGANGIYNLQGGVVNSNILIVGGDGTGTFVQTGGTLNMPTWVSYPTEGLAVNGNGLYELNGGLLITGYIYDGVGSGTFAFGGGTLQANDVLSTALPMLLTGVGGAATVDTAGYDVSLTGSLTGPGSLTKVGSGTLFLGATNSFTGNTLVRGGTLALASPLALQQSTFDSSGSGMLSFGTLTTATFGGLTGSGTLTLTNSSAVAVALSVGNNNANTTYSGRLTGPGSLTKVGSGTLLMTGVNSYTGPTTIAQGTLMVNGSLTSPVTVSGGVLAGSGTAGAATVNAGGTIMPGSLGSGTLTAATITLSPGSVLNFQFAAAGNNHINVTGANGLTINGGGIDLYQQGTNSPLVANGTYYLIRYSGSLGGSLASLSLLNGELDKRYVLGAGGNQVYVQVASGPVWNGGNTSSNNWSQSANWSGVAPVVGDSLTLDGNTRTSCTNDLAAGMQFNSLWFRPTSGAFAISGNSLALSGNIINSSSNLQTISVPLALHGGCQIQASGGPLTFNGRIDNGGAPLVVSGSNNVMLNGQLSGSGSLTMSGGGKLVLAASNSFSGGLNLLSGVVVAAQANRLGTGPLYFSGGTLWITSNLAPGFSLGGMTIGPDGATLDMDSGNSVFTLLNSIDGVGSLTKTGPSTLVLAASSSFGGGVTVNQGQVRLRNQAALGSGGLTLATGGSVDLNSQGATIVSLSGGSGSIVTDLSSTPGVTTLTISMSSATTSTFAGSILQGGNRDIALALSGSGRLVLSGSNSYLGGTEVSGGTLVLTSPVAIADGTDLAIGDAALFSLVNATTIPAVSTAAVSLVPEPPSLTLLAATVIGLFGNALRKRMRPT